jgi:hypothetical protein
MARQSADALHHKGRIAALTRSREPDDPELLAARESYWRASWSDRVEKLVAEAPPLCREDLQEIATLLKMRVVETGGAAQ